MQQYSSYSDLVQGALEVEDIEKAFSSRRQDKGKKKLSFSSAKSWFRKFRGSQRQGQPSSSPRVPVDLGGRAEPTAAPHLARRSTSYMEVPSAMQRSDGGSRTT